MDIHFDRNAEDYQKARRLRAILKQCYASATDNEIRSVIAALERQLESCLADPGLSQFSPSAQDDRVRPSFSLVGIIMSIWHSIAGPGRREQELSKQRREQLERAEHAEISAFEALAEAAELKITLEQAQRKIHELEAELGRRPGSN